MRVEVYMQSTFHEREREVLRCMYNGIKKDLWPENFEENAKAIAHMNRKKGFGSGVELTYNERARKYDLAVMFGSWKPERGNLHHKVRSAIAENDNPFLCIETQLLGRKVGVESEYHRVGINGFLNEAAIFGIEKDYDNVRFKSLELPYNGWKQSRGDKIVIALQLPGDASLRSMDINNWCIWILQQLQNLTDRPIEIRTHPGLSSKGIDAHLPIYQYLAFNNIKSVEFVNGADIPWEEQILDAHCIVAFTSGLSIDAVLNGIPVIACDPGNFAWSISSNDINEIENPLLKNENNVQEWLNTLAYCQWSKEEMANGKAWAHLKPAVLKLIKQNKEEEDESS